MSAQKLRLGVLGTSEIALRRFLPALSKVEDVEYAGVAVALPFERESGLANVFSSKSETDLPTLRANKRARQFQELFGGSVYNGYADLLADASIDAVYVPLPPGIHFYWGKSVLESGKHLLMEKPFTTLLKDTTALLETAQDRTLAVHENYMFKFHSQIQWLLQYVSSNELGKIRLIRIDFGFPFRGIDDFRYSAVLGGGALFDCGGYTINLASLLLGSTAQVISASLQKDKKSDVDIAGAITLENDDGLVAQISFGMDNDYRCSIDVWGSTGSLFNGRILTPPANYKPTMVITKNDSKNEIYLEPDDSFANSIDYFLGCIANQDKRFESYAAIARQAALVQSVMSKAIIPNT